jgi:hypothetical protein
MKWAVVVWEWHGRDFELAGETVMWCFGDCGEEAQVALIVYICFPCSAYVGEKGQAGEEK